MASAADKLLYVAALLLLVHVDSGRCVDRLFSSNMWDGAYAFFNTIERELGDSDCKRDLLAIADKLPHEEWALSCKYYFFLLVKLKFLHF